MLVLYLSMLDKKADKQTFEQIYRKHHEDIFRCTYHLLGNDRDVEDAMQETWLGVLKSMPLLKDRDDSFVRAYIMGIARNQSIAVIRKRRREAGVFCDMEKAELIDDTDLFEQCELEGVSRVMECIDMLSQEQRDVIILHYLYHRSIKEIAGILHISETTAESRRGHGRKKLMKLLIGRGVYVKKDDDRT